MMSLWDALRMNMMISYQELVRTFLNAVVLRFCALSIYVITSSYEFYKVRTIKCIMPIPITK
ncbi:ydjO [Escherichia coli]|nr:ydjO [Escherichia coli]